jgi:HEAT repeat protein
MTRRGILATSILSLTLLFPAAALGQPAKVPAKQAPAKGVGPAPAKLRPILSDLDSSDVGKVRHAIAELESDGSPAAAHALSAFVEAGPPGPALVPAIRAIAGMHRAESVELLLSLTRHRRPDARVAAAEGLSNYRQMRVAAALENLLSDPDADVRDAGAGALATAGTRQNVELLFRALDRRVDEAARAIGQLGNADDVAKLAEKLGRTPLETLLPGLEAALLRSDLSAAARIAVVQKLGALETPEVKDFLERVALVQPTAAVKAAMLEAAERIAT